jgi:hypothetical protein
MSGSDLPDLEIKPSAFMSIDLTSPVKTLLLVITLASLVAAIIYTTDGLKVSSVGYTELYLISVNDLGVRVGMLNQERAPMIYTLVAERGNLKISSLPIKLQVGQQWEGTVTVPSSSAERVDITLYRRGAILPYRKLSILMDRYDKSED